MPIVLHKNKKTGEKVYIPSNFKRIIYKNYIEKTIVYIEKEKLIEFLKKEGQPLPFEEDNLKKGDNDD